VKTEKEFAMKLNLKTKSAGMRRGLCVCVYGHHCHIAAHLDSFNNRSTHTHTAPQSKIQ